MSTQEKSASRWGHRKLLLGLVGLGVSQLATTGCDFRAAASALKAGAAADHQKADERAVAMLGILTRR